MLRFAFLASLFFSPFASAQYEPVPPERPVLRAIPLGGEDDIGARPSSGSEPLIPAAPAVLEPAAPEPVAPTPPPEVVEATPIESIAPSTPLELKPTGDDAVRLQIFLDESNFGPGVIDGKPGRFTELAVQSWNEVNGYPLNDWTGVNRAARKAVPNPLAMGIVPEIAEQWVDTTLPTSRALQAKRKRMSYRSLAEFMSERYHCDIPYLIALNGSSKIYNLKLRDTIIVPNVQPFRIENLTGAAYKSDDRMSMRHAVVDTKINQIRIFEAAPAAIIVAEPSADGQPTLTRRNRGLIASFPITPGQPKFIEFGTWELRNMVEMPWWRYDQQFLDTGKRSENALQIPPGPNSPVGVIWNGTSRSGIGLHGTSDPETIGRARSAGCIRLANWDAIRLPDLIRPGTTIEIR
jgi:lipoprotein-anchoring transpeptidase ErfK/SrfK